MISRPIYTLVLAGFCLPAILNAEVPLQRTSNDLTGLRQPAIELLNPGTVIGDQAPEGWTHLILKSQPSLSAEEQKKVGKLTAGYATMVFTATAAEVRKEREGGSFRLIRLGFGVGVNVKGLSMVVTPETEKKFGAGLSVVSNSVLAGVHDKQKLIRLVAATPYGAIVDTPAFMPKDAGHAAVLLRYAFLVDPRSGSLQTLVWRIDLDSRGASEGVRGHISWLKPGVRIDAALQADLSEFTLGIPSEKAFAVVRIPAGEKEFSWPKDLEARAGQLKLTEEDAQQLDGTLRILMQNTRTDVFFDSPAAKSKAR